MNQVFDSPPATGQRGPADSIIREQIVKAANDHFLHYGYDKTTVSDLDKAVGFSKAYIYKFFDSKQAIGEAICSQCQGKIFAQARQAVDESKTATEKYRRFFRGIVDATVAFLFNERRLYDMAAVSTAERWDSFETHVSALHDTLREIILLGRETGEFERKTPIDETCRVILQVMQPFTNPLMLEFNIERVPDGPNEIANLVLRSLAP
jgi:AcrR family transcriptional regulator